MITSVTDNEGLFNHLCEVPVTDVEGLASCGGC